MNKEETALGKQVPVSEAQSHPVHSCMAWNTEHWHNSATATWTSCGVCGNVTAFRYKSFWQRIRAFLCSTQVRP